MTDTEIDRLTGRPRLVAHVCLCGHWESDHEGSDLECAYGWADEPDEDEPCDCLGYVHDADLVR